MIGKVGTKVKFGKGYTFHLVTEMVKIYDEVMCCVTMTSCSELYNIQYTEKEIPGGGYWNHVGAVERCMLRTLQEASWPQKFWQV
jgi:hypothetical protein